MPLSAGYMTGERAGTDRGRFKVLPYLYKKAWASVAATDDDKYAVTHLGAATAGTTSQTLTGVAPDHPRNVVITVTHDTAVVAMSGVITGTDADDKVQTEAWAVTATGTSKVFTVVKAFKTITSITEVVAADASANSIISGTGKVLGFDRKVAVASAVKEVAGGSVVTNGTVVAASTTSTADKYGTYTPNGSPSGTAYDLYVIVDDMYTTPNPNA